MTMKMMTTLMLTNYLTLMIIKIRGKTSQRQQRLRIPFLIKSLPLRSTSLRKRMTGVMTGGMMTRKKKTLTILIMIIQIWISWVMPSWRNTNRKWRSNLNKMSWSQAMLGLCMIKEWISQLWTEKIIVGMKRKMLMIILMMTFNDKF